MSRMAHRLGERQRRLLGRVALGGNPQNDPAQ